MKTAKPSARDFLKLRSKTLISLLEIMLHFAAYNVYDWEDVLRRSLSRFSKRKETDLLTRKEKKHLAWLSNEVIGNQCKEMGMIESDNRVMQLQMMSQSIAKYATVRLAKHELIELQSAILRELGERKFVLVEPAKTKFFDKDKLFGNKVYRKLPDARQDIKDAGNCLSLEFYTAAIFHLMRATECAMRALAIHLNVKLKAKPIEHAGWDELLKQIEKRIRIRREGYDKSQRKNRKEFEKLKFYRMMADELFMFKEVWRNNTMHSISSYNEQEANGLFVRVENFMQRLASGLTAKNKR